MEARVFDSYGATTPDSTVREFRSRQNLADWREQALTWLTEYAVTEDGGVLSWCNNRHPGYVYSEVGGYLLSLLSLEASFRASQSVIAERLIHDLRANGSAGRAGTSYLFDTGMVLRGLLLVRKQACSRNGTHSDLDAAFSFVTTHIRRREAVQGRHPSTFDAARWSSCFGPHQLKVAQATLAYHEQFDEPRAWDATERLLENALSYYASGTFRAFPGRPDCILHSHCYALEGLLSLRASDLWDRGFNDIVLAGAGWLADVQNSAGGFPEWHDGERSWGRSRADVAAQALRIWLIVAPQRFEKPIARALGFLQSLRAPSGALRFTPQSGDENTWATIFLAQVLGQSIGLPICEIV
jgi:hypothetical protein